MGSSLQIENITIVLVEPLYDINVGYIARVMKNFSLKNLLVVNPQCEIGDVALRYAMHGREILLNMKKVDSLTAVFEKYDLVVATSGKTSMSKQYRRRFLTPEELVELISKFEGQVAILFGREDIGLTNDIVESSDLLVSIPANPEYSTLNISHAVAIIAYVIFNHLLKSRRKLLKIASKKDRELLLEILSRLFEKTHIPSHKLKKAILVMRRILGRASITKEETYALLTAFRRVLSFIEHEEI